MQITITLLLNLQKSQYLVNDVIMVVKLESNATFTLNGFGDQERNLTFVKVLSSL